MNKTVFSAYTFSSRENINFDAVKYSKLKFGSDSVAKEFGHDLAQKFFDTHKEKLLTKPVLVVPSPYNYIHNAATVMTKHFIDKLNILLVEAGGIHVEYDIIKRITDYINDYGFQSKEVRKKLINSSKFFINKNYFTDKILIFIDDCRITGAHEEKIIDILEKENIDEDTMFLYYTKYVGDMSNSQIEGFMNFAAINSIDDLVELSKEEKYHLIIRPTKYIMGLQHLVFKEYISKAPKMIVEQLYHNCFNEGYYNVPEYKENFTFLKQFNK